MTRALQTAVLALLCTISACNFSLPPQCAADVDCRKLDPNSHCVVTAGYCRPGAVGDGGLGGTGSSSSGTNGSSGTAGTGNSGTATSGSTTGTPVQPCLDYLAPRYGATAAPFSFVNRANGVAVEGANEGDLVSGFMIVGGIGTPEPALPGGDRCLALPTTTFFETSPRVGYAAFSSNPPRLNIGVAYAAVASLPQDPTYPFESSPLFVFGGQPGADGGSYPLQTYPGVSASTEFIDEKLIGLGANANALAATWDGSKDIVVTGVTSSWIALSCSWAPSPDQPEYIWRFQGLGCSDSSGSLSPRLHHAVVRSSSMNIFALGGIDADGGVLAGVQEFTQTGGWTDAGQMGLARAALVAAADNLDRFYAIGGVTQPHVALRDPPLYPTLNNMEVWDTLGDAGWQDAGPVPLGGRFGAAGGYDPLSNSIFIFMGLTGNGSSIQNNYDVFSIADGGWFTCPALPDAGACVRL